MATHAGPEKSDGLDRVRHVAQELHKTISDTLAKRASATKADVEGAIQKAKTAAESARSAMQAKHDAAQDTIKKKLTAAVDKLDSAEKHAAESLKKPGEALHMSLSKALADSRESIQKISEAIAARRSEHAAKHAGTRKAS